LDGRNTFAKRERLQRGFQFRRVYEQGGKVEGRLVVVYVREAAPEDRAVGVVTSRRIGGAVVRNRARRLLREAYRLNKHKLKPNLQIVMVARTAINGKRLQEVEANVVQLLEAAGAIKKP
jgi:ribonuclease P protein component